MSDFTNDPATVDRVLELPRWFIVGLGNNPARVAYEVAEHLQRAGKIITPIYPRAEVVHGAQGFATLTQAAAALGAPDVVDIFIRSSAAGKFVDEAIDIGAKAVWLQLGVIDEAAAERARAAGLDVVMNTCPLIEWRERGSL